MNQVQPERVQRLASACDRFRGEIMQLEREAEDLRAALRGRTAAFEAERFRRAAPGWADRLIYEIDTREQAIQRLRYVVVVLTAPEEAPVERLGAGTPQPPPSQSGFNELAAASSAA